MKKFKYLLFTFVFMLCMIPNIKADVITTDINLQSVQMRGSTYTGNDITRFKIDSTDLIGIYQTTYSENLLSTYSIFNLNNSFDSTVDKIGFFYYNSLLFYGNSSNVVGPTGNSYNTLEVIPPLVRLNNKSCSVKPIGSTSATNPSGYDYSSFFWVECDILSNSSPNVVNVRYIPKSGPSNMTIGIQPKIFTWSNIDTQEEIKNAIDSTNDKLDDTNDKLNDLNDNISSTEGPTNLGALDNSAGWLPTGPLDSILNLPLSLFNSLLTSISSTCQPLNLTFPFVDFNYQLPCISSLYSKIDGANAVIDFVGLVIGVLILYYYFIHLYNWVDSKLTMQYNNDWGGV